MLVAVQQFWSQSAGDPVLLYSLAAAFLLALVSLSSGLSHADALVLLRPRILVRVLGAVALAFLLRLAAEAAQGAQLPALVAAALPGLHRFPLYLSALAYGPTTGLLVACLFAAFASSTLLPGAPEAVLALELTVLGWLAIFPSPRVTRLAGPLNGALAYVLAWGTGGVALLAHRGETVTLTRLLAEHRALLPGLALALALLALVGPAAYRRAFPRSRIAGLAAPRAAAAAGQAGAHERRLPLRELVPAELLGEPRRNRLGPAPLFPGELVRQGGRPGRSRRLAPRSLPDDDLVR